MSKQQPPKVYREFPMEGFEWVLAIAKGDSLKMSFDGTPRSATWVPVKVARLKYDEDNGSRLIPSDFPSGSGMFTVSRAAKEQLGSCLEEAGELLPLDCEDGEFWTLNVTRTVDALNEEGSEVLRSSETGRILMIHRHRFFADRLGPEIFKLSSTPRGLIYFTDEFVQRVKATNLKGIDFKLVWAPN